jgi:hypothetical protein
LQEKESQMPEDLGKDLNSVDRLKRLHETFEADLAPLEKQVRRHKIFIISLAKSQWENPQVNSSTVQ